MSPEHKTFDWLYLNHPIFLQRHILAAHYLLSSGLKTIVDFGCGPNPIVNFMGRKGFELSYSVDPLQTFEKDLSIEETIDPNFEQIFTKSFFFKQRLSECFDKIDIGVTPIGLVALGLDCSDTKSLELLAVIASKAKIVILETPEGWGPGQRYIQYISQKANIKPSLTTILDFSNNIFQESKLPIMVKRKFMVFYNKTKG